MILIGYLQIRCGTFTLTVCESSQPYSTIVSVWDRSLSVHVNFGTYNFGIWVFGAVNFGTLNVNFGTCHVRYTTDQLRYMSISVHSATMTDIPSCCVRFATQPNWLVSPEGLRWRKELTRSLYGDPLLLPLFVTVFTLLCLLLDL